MIIKIEIKKKKIFKNETINFTKILYKTAIFNIKSLRDKKEIYGGI